jgi:hypothetical protein
MPYQIAIKVQQPIEGRTDGAVQEIVKFCQHEHATMNDAWSCSSFDSQADTFWLAENQTIIDGPTRR